MLGTVESLKLFKMASEVSKKKEINCNGYNFKKIFKIKSIIKNPFTTCIYIMKQQLKNRFNEIILYIWSIELVQLVVCNFKGLMTVTIEQSIGSLQQVMKTFVKYV